MLLAVAPSKAFAQTLSQTVVAQSEQNISRLEIKSKPNLKTLFAEETAKNKSRATLSAADIKRLEKENLNPQTTTRSGSGFSKRDAILAVVIVVAITALAIVLAHNGVDPKPRCEDEPGTPDCIQ